MWRSRGTETSVLAAYVCGLRGHMTSVLATPCLWRLWGYKDVCTSDAFWITGVQNGLLY